jgi:pyruvate/2-oxoglutarate dehydrogenase complex dihydrolipoamide dehydrogenase (E3) component
VTSNAEEGEVLDEQRLLPGNEGGKRELEALEDSMFLTIRADELMRVIQYCQRKGNTYDFDLFVIGGGSAGISAAKTATAAGVKVGLADFVDFSRTGAKWGPGGTSTNAGYVPQKMIHYACQLGDWRKDLHACGWNPDMDISHNWETMVKNV